MLGSRVGSRVGPLVGSAVGSGADDEAVGGIAGVTRDGSSGWYCPATLAEWTTFMSAIGLATGNPSAIWLFQDASGNPAEVTGTFPLTASGTTRLYNVIVPGWSRFAITNQTDGGTSAWATTSASLPDVSTASLTVVAFVLMPSAAPAGTRQIIAEGTTTRVAFNMNTTPRALGVSGANTGTGAVDPTGTNTVRLVILKHNKTGSADALYTDQEKIVPTFSTLTTGRSITFGNVSVGTIAGGFLYGAAFFNAAGEFSDAQAKTLGQGLTGLSFPWS